MLRISSTLLLSLLALLSLSACKEKKDVPEINSGPIPGEIQLLNGCGIPKASEKVRNYLMDKGFDIIETGNAHSWNYKKTLILLRRPDWPGTEALKKALGTENVLLLRNPNELVDVSVYLGKDIEEILLNDRKPKP